MTDKVTRIQLRKNLIDDGDEEANSNIDTNNVYGRSVSIIIEGISKAEVQQIGATIKKGMAEDDFEESIDDLDKATEAQ